MFETWGGVDQLGRENAAFHMFWCMEGARMEYNMSSLFTWGGVNQNNSVKLGGELQCSAYESRMKIITFL